MGPVLPVFPRVFSTLSPLFLKKKGMIMRKIITFYLICFILFLASGCESDAQTGALLGAAAGGAIGQAAGRDTESTLIGAGVGAAGGYLIGKQSDDAKRRDAENKVEIDVLREEMNTEAVIVTNSNGSTIAVILKKDGRGGYYGPRGEHYDKLPTQEQLRPVYGF